MGINLFYREIYVFMGDGKKKTGLIIGLIVFGILALGSLVSGVVGAALDESKDIETGKVAFEEKKSEPAKQEEVPKEKEIEPEKVESINSDEVKAE